MNGNHPTYDVNIITKYNTIVLKDVRLTDPTLRELLEQPYIESVNITSTQASNKKRVMTNGDKH